MPPIATAKPDGVKIRALIERWAKARGLRAEVSPFARSIGVPRQSLQNIISQEVLTGRGRMRQIARGLGVRPSDISDMPPEEDDPEALAS